MRSFIILAFGLALVLTIAELTPVNGEDLFGNLERKGGSKCKGKHCLEGKKIYTKTCQPWF